MAKAKKRASSSSLEPIRTIVSKEEKDLVVWEALERPYQRRGKEFWTTVLSVLGLVSLILFFVKEWFLIMALAALVFLYYVLTTIPPQKGKHRLTNKGIYLDQSQRIDWEVLRRFWLAEKWGHHTLNIETLLNFPRVVSFVVPEENKKKVVEVMEKHLPQEKESPNFVDKFSFWIANKFPLEEKK